MLLCLPLIRTRLLVWIDWRVSLFACKVTFARFVKLWHFKLLLLPDQPASQGALWCLSDHSWSSSEHSEELSLPLAGLRRVSCSSCWLTRVPSQCRKKHGCCQPPGCSVSPGWRELIYAEKKCFHLDVDQKLFYEKLKKAKHKFPVIFS